MAEDLRSAISGDFKYGFPITCILEEGAVTISENAFTPTGLKETVATLGNQIVKGDLVYLIPGEKNMYVETHGMPVVEKLTSGTLFTGKVMTNPEWNVMPAATKAFTDCDNANWAAILAGKWFRTATVELFGISDIFTVDVLADSSNTVIIADQTSIKWDVSEGYFVPVGAAGGGLGLLPLHYSPAGTSGDKYTILVAPLLAGLVSIA